MNFYYNNSELRSDYSYQNGVDALSFTGANIYANAEKRLQKIEYMFRVIGNRIASLFEKKSAKLLTKDIAQITPQSNEKYLSQLFLMGHHYGSKKIIDVNIEDMVLEKIAKENKANIFIMNHSNQKQDPAMLAVLNTLLAKAYKDAGKENNFPLPKIILNKDILKSMDITKRKAFENFGAVGIDANIFSADKKSNAKVFLPLIKDFIQDKINIFIFPEGKLSVFNHLDFDVRFQDGVVELINKVLNIKKEVSVVPVGFAYGKGKNKGISGMHIGEPIKFKRDGEITTTTSGLALKSEFAPEVLKKFFVKHKNKTDVVITENGVPAKLSDTPDFIKGILVENMKICACEAQNKVKHSQNTNDYIKI